MKFVVKKGSLAEAKVDALVIGLHSDRKKLDGSIAILDRRMRGALGEVWKLGEFSGELGDSVLLPAARTSAKRLVVMGLGPSKSLGSEQMREAFAAAAATCRKSRLRSAAVAVDVDVLDHVQAIVEGMSLSAYDCALHKKAPAGAPRPVSRVQIFVADDEIPMARMGIARGEAMANGVIFTRDLVNEPSNLLTPQDMAAAAQGLAEQSECISCKVWGEKEIQKAGMGGLIGVGQGSRQPSQFIQLHYKPTGEAGAKLRKLALVGKGITFDTGGISIKPSNGMEIMKTDMGGSAAVLGAFKILGEVQPPIEVSGFVAAAENMPDGNAIKPGDLLTMMNGMTVEVNNTDAEGRLVLADALHFACEQKPDWIVDAATLTGACMVALGDCACGLMSEDEDLVAAIQKAAQACNEPVWRLPLLEMHRKKMEGHVADLKNTGPREGGALTAAGFLSHFAEGVPWAHLDVAAMVWSDEAKPISPKGATGYGARLLATLAMELGHEE